MVYLFNINLYVPGLFFDLFLLFLISIVIIVLRVYNLNIQKVFRKYTTKYLFFNYLKRKLQLNDFYFSLIHFSILFLFFYFYFYSYAYNLNFFGYGLFIENSLTLGVKKFLVLVLLILVLFSNKIKLNFKIVPEYPVFFLGLFSLLFALVVCNSFFSMYIILEGVTLSLIALFLATYKNSLILDSILKYFILSIATSVFFVSGIVALYGEFNVFSFDDFSFIYYENTSVGLLFVIIGLCFKLTLVPFHQWVIDVYDALDYETLIILAVAIKTSIFIVLLRILSTFYFFKSVFLLLLLIGIFSTIIGSLGAAGQNKISKFLAYGSISQLGMVFSLLGTKSYYHVIYAYISFYFYMFTLLVMLICLVIFSNNGINNRYFNNFSFKMKSYSRLYFWLFIGLLISLAGLPPFLGFFYKFYIIKSFFDINFYFVGSLILFFNIFSAFYYLRIVKLLIQKYNNPVFKNTPLQFFFIFVFFSLPIFWVYIYFPNIIVSYYTSMVFKTITPALLYV
jgi:NADH-quinone oxidoreductase subunit N